jgi:ubiquitin-conjugating enzyme E2 Z
MSSLDKVVTKKTLQRIISDISDIIKNPLHDHGIYYEHDEENMLMGYVLIIPQMSDSPYKHGNYLFTIEYPTNYPYSPPKMTYLTNNQKTRFHPNLYRNGKVCLSLLNTWKGEQWTACNTLSSILLNITTLFTDKPFLHEPGINEQHESFNDYTKIIKYQNINTAIYEVLTSTIYLEQMKGAKKQFQYVAVENYKKHSSEIMKFVEDMSKNSDDTIAHVPFYKMYNENLDYKELYVKLKEYNNNIL